MRQLDRHIGRRFERLERSGDELWTVLRQNAAAVTCPITKSLLGYSQTCQCYIIALSEIGIGKHLSGVYLGWHAHIAFITGRAQFMVDVIPHAVFETARKTADGCHPPYFECKFEDAKCLAPMGSEKTLVSGKRFQHRVIKPFQMITSKAVDFVSHGELAHRVDKLLPVGREYIGKVLRFRT